MHVLIKSGEKIELTPIPTTVAESKRTHALRVEVASDVARDPMSTGALVAHAARGFFEMGRREGNVGTTAPPKGPPPVTFRDDASGALPIVYRELTVRFKPKVPQETCKKIRLALGFRVRRRSLFARDQVVVYHPDRKYRGEQLLEIANAWTALDEVVFAMPNFVSQYWRQANLPTIPLAEWHLRNKGLGAAIRGEDVNDTLFPIEITADRGGIRELWQHLHQLDDYEVVNRPGFSGDLRV
jgi:hypothetical protein